MVRVRVRRRIKMIGCVVGLANIYNVVEFSVKSGEQSCWGVNGRRMFIRANIRYLLGGS